MSDTHRTIEVIVSATGDVAVQTKGFAGASCRDASAFLERALGERAAERLTPEFYQPQPAVAEAEQRS